MATLKNEKLTIEIANHGAEIRSVKDAENTEYIWCGDKAIWGRHAPVLFPIVGKVNGDSYTAEGETFHLTQHGFARDMDFDLIEESENSLTFALESNEESHKKYPYDFHLEITYTLEGNAVTVQWKVINTDSRTIYFSIGAHPAFIGSGENLIGSELTFETDVASLEYGILSDCGLLSDRTGTLELKNKKVTVTADFFDEDALIFEHTDIKSVSLSDDGRRIAKVDFDAPLFGIWSAKCKGVPYICIEPWYGRADRDDFRGDFSEREYGNSLKVGGVFCKQYTITFGE